VEQHVKILAILNIVLGGLGIATALVVLIFFGGLSALVNTDSDPGGAAVLGLVGGVAFLVILVFSIPCVIAGFGLLKYRSWAQMLTIVMSILNLVSFPFGTALGIYGLWVLLNKETKPLFRLSLNS
jgi:hypothetical protein